jgi:DNA polymerase
MTGPSSDDLQLAQRIVRQRLESLQRAGVQQIGRVPSGAGSGTVSVAAVQAATVPPARGVDVQPAVASSPTPADRIHQQIAAAAQRETLDPLLEPAMPRAKGSSAPTGAPAIRKSAAGSPLVGASVVSQPYTRDLPQSLDGRQHELALIRDIVAHCTLCKELACTRTQTVFGVGNVKPRVVFFGEAPGADEDRLGEPFVGRAGQLLTKIIEACTWKREDVYILNVLKCRPPGNRTPLPPEVDNCRQYFERQFDILQPEYIVCVGAVPAQALLETTEAVGKLRGRFHKYRDSKVLVTYHPSYLLRNPAAKKFVWEDMQILLRDMGVAIPGRS